MSSRKNSCQLGFQAGRRLSASAVDPAGQTFTQLMARVRQFLAETLNINQRRTQIMRGHIHNRFQFLVLFRQRLGQVCQASLGFLALTDIPYESREKTPLGQVDLAYRQIHRKHGSILSLPNHFPANADNFRLPRSHVIGHVTVMFLPVRRRHQQTDILPDYLLGLETKHLFRSRIHGLHGPVFVDGDDGLDRRLQNGPQTLRGIAQVRARLASWLWNRTLIGVFATLEAPQAGNQLRPGNVRVFAHVATHALSVNRVAKPTLSSAKPQLRAPSSCTRYSVGDWPRIFLNTRLKCVSD
jgi:hypothetical protein